MCCAPIVYMFVYILIGAHIVPLSIMYEDQCGIFIIAIECWSASSTVFEIAACPAVLNQ